MESTADPAELPSLGQVLGDERERQGLSRTDIAQRLHMSVWQVEALETGDLARLPKGPFLRGFVRNYAKLLGLNPDSVLAMLAEMMPRAAAPGIVVPTQNIRFDPLNDRFASPYMKAGGIALFLVILGFAAVYWWVAVRTAPPASSPSSTASTARRAASGPSPQNIAAAPVPPPEPVVMQPAPLVTEPAKAAGVPPRVDAAQARSQQVSSTAQGSTLRFRFKGSSWVEIRDARGKVLLSRLNEAGSEAEVSGRPPLTVVVGNAPEVEVIHNGRPLQLAAHTKVSVARFTLE